MYAGYTDSIAHRVYACGYLDVIFLLDEITFLLWGISASRIYFSCRPAWTLPVWTMGGWLFCFFRLIVPDHFCRLALLFCFPTFVV